MVHSNLETNNFLQKKWNPIVRQPELEVVEESPSKPPLPKGIYGTNRPPDKNVKAWFNALNPDENNKLDPARIDLEEID